MNILDTWGLYGPDILGFATLLILYNKQTWLVAYIFGYIFNTMLNILLKVLFRYPRPNEDLSLFYAGEKKGITQYNSYGMPSGHAQSAIFSTAYIWFSTHNYWIVSFYIITCCLTFYQRLKYNSHDLLQLFVGSAIGLSVAYFFSVYVKHKIPGILRMKKDDD